MGHLKGKELLFLTVLSVDMGEAVLMIAFSNAAGIV